MWPYTRPCLTFLRLEAVKKNLAPKILLSWLEPMTLTNETVYSSTEPTKNLAKLAPKINYKDIGPKSMLDQLVVRPSPGINNRKPTHNIEGDKWSKIGFHWRTLGWNLKEKKMVLMWQSTRKVRHHFAFGHTNLSKLFMIMSFLLSYFTN